MDFSKYPKYSSLPEMCWCCDGETDEDRTETYIDKHLSMYSILPEMWCDGDAKTDPDTVYRNLENAIRENPSALDWVTIYELKEDKVFTQMFAARRVIIGLMKNLNNVYISFPRCKCDMKCDPEEYLKKHIRAIAPGCEDAGLYYVRKFIEDYKIARENNSQLLFAGIIHKIDNNCFIGQLLAAQDVINALTGKRNKTRLSFPDCDCKLKCDPEDYIMTHIDTIAPECGETALYYVCAFIEKYKHSRNSSSQFDRNCFIADLFAAQDVINALTSKLKEKNGTVPRCNCEELCEDYRMYIDKHVCDVAPDCNETGLYFIRNFLIKKQDKVKDMLTGDWFKRVSDDAKRYGVKLNRSIDRKKAVNRTRPRLQACRLASSCPYKTTTCNKYHNPNIDSYDEQKLFNNIHNKRVVKRLKKERDQRERRHRRDREPTHHEDYQPNHAQQYRQQPLLQPLDYSFYANDNYTFHNRQPCYDEYYNQYVSYFGYEQQMYY